MAKYNINPCPKPRMTQRDRWLHPARPCVARYRAFCDEVKLLGITISNGCTVLFGVPMPKSWSEKKKKSMEGEYHYQTPDLDNFLKAIMDSIYTNDSHIVEIRIIKRWSREGYIEVSI